MKNESLASKTELCVPHQFIGTKPLMLHIDAQDYKVKNWQDVVRILLTDCNRTRHDQMKPLCGKMWGRKRPIFHTAANEMTRPIKIDENMYFEGYLVQSIC